MRKPYRKAPEFDSAEYILQLNKEEAIKKSPDLSKMQIIKIDDRTSIVRPIGDDPDKARSEYFANYNGIKHIINNIV